MDIVLSVNLPQQKDTIVGTYINHQLVALEKMLPNNVVIV